MTRYDRLRSNPHARRGPHRRKLHDRAVELGLGESREARVDVSARCERFTEHHTDVRTPTSSRLDEAEDDRTWTCYVQDRDSLSDYLVQQCVALFVDDCESAEG
jgi:hypothetical protein